jgi:hypothetical protein
MRDLTEFLLARIAEDEAAADRLFFRRELAPPIFAGDPPRYGYYTVRDRVLAECEAKRRIVEVAAWLLQDGTRAQLTAHQLLGALALPYADHPDYREEWRSWGT